MCLFCCGNMLAAAAEVEAAPCWFCELFEGLERMLAGGWSALGRPIVQQNKKNWTKAKKPKLGRAN